MSDRFNVEIERLPTANGGWEWYLLVGGERVHAGTTGVGLFTSPDATAPEMLQRLLKRTPPIREGRP